MTLRTRILLSTIFGFFVLGASAYSEGKFDSNSDIRGYSLSMTKSQVLNKVKTSFKRDDYFLIQAPIETQYYSENYLLGIEADFISYVDKFGHSNTTTTGQDRIFVFFNPISQSNDIFAVSRYVFYDPEKNPTTVKSIEKSMEEKYGKPTILSSITVSGHDHHYYIWSLDTEGLQNSDSIRQLRIESLSYFHFPSYIMPSTGQTVAYSAEGKAQNFMELFKSPDEIAKLSKTHGKILAICIVADNQDSVYTNNMTEVLIDVDKANRELNECIDGFWAKIEKNRTKTILNDNAKKPAL